MALTKATYSMIVGAAVNVLDYGAVGNGIADDTTALQAAINAAHTASKPVYLPAGTYKVIDSLVLYDNAVVFGDGFRITTITGTLANKSILRTQYGETPSYTQRTTGWNLRDFAINANSASTSTGLNCGNVGYSSLSNLYISNASIGLFCSQRTYYLFSYGLQVQNCSVCLDLQSDGGGNHFVNSNFGFLVSGVYIRQGGWDFTGGVIDTGTVGAAACIDVGIDGGAGDASMNLANIYVEAVDSATAAINFYGNTVNSSVFGLQRRNSVGSVSYSALCDKTQITNISQTGQFNYQLRSIQMQMGSDINTGVVDLYLESQGNQLNVKNNTNTAYGYLGANAFLPDGTFAVRWLGGSGSPEGSVTGSPGAMYLRNNGGAGTTLYIKETGTGNTGWVGK